MQMNGTRINTDRTDKHRKISENPSDPWLSVSYFEFLNHPESEKKEHKTVGQFER